MEAMGIHFCNLKDYQKSTSMKKSGSNKESCLVPFQLEMFIIGFRVMFYAIYYLFTIFLKRCNPCVMVNVCLP